MTRYFFVILLMALIGVAIVVKAGITMFAEISLPLYIVYKKYVSDKLGNYGSLPDALS